MPNDRRRRKKNLKRGRVAAPKIRHESSGEMIPGVPSFQGGGPIVTPDQRLQGRTPRPTPRASDLSPREVSDLVYAAFIEAGLSPSAARFAIRVAKGESDLGQNQTGDGGLAHGIFQLHEQGKLDAFYQSGFDDPYDPYQSAQFTAQHIAVEGNAGWQPWTIARDLMDMGVDPGAGGGVSGAQAPQWRPGEFGLEQEGLAIREEVNRIDLQIAEMEAELQRERMSLEQAIADRRADLAETTEARIADIEKGKLSLEQLRTMIDAKMQTGRLSLEQLRTMIDASQEQQRIAQGERGQDITQRGQDIQAQLETINAQIRQDEILRQDAIAREDIGLRQQIEARMSQNIQQQNLLQQRQQDIQVRGQDIDTQLTLNQQGLQQAQMDRQFAIDASDQALQRDAEERIRAHQQQQVALQQHAAQLQGFGLGMEAQRGGGAQMGQLAQSLGDIEARRAEFLSGLAANPRDFMQLQFGLGAGQSFLNDIMEGRPIQGQSTAQIGTTPTLGPGMERLAQAVTARPDLPFFNEARQMARELGQMRPEEAPGLQQLLDLGALPDVSPPPVAPPPADIQRPEVAPPAPVIQPPGPSQADILAWVNADPRLGGGPVRGRDILAWNEAYPGGAPPAAAPALPPAIPPPDIGFTPPPTIVPAGPGSEVPPSQRPGLPQPGIPEPPIPMPPGFGGLARGGQLVTDEPIVGMGMRSGMPKFTLNEPTRQYPQGVPELLQAIPGGMKVTPLQFGGQVSTRPQNLLAAPRQPTQPQLRAAPPLGPRRAPGQVIQNMMRGLTPRARRNMLPSQQGLTSSIVSAFGVVPEDFWESLRRSDPRGINPGAIQSASFRYGGRILAMPRVA